MELLANDIRPIKLNDVYGQNHLIGEGKILTNLVKNKKLFSMIFYGNPGCGKTSIANALVNELNMPYRMLNAVINKKTESDYYNVVYHKRAPYLGKSKANIDDLFKTEDEEW